MPGPLEAAGALPEPSEYATLSMDRHLTGLWTQRSPMRDADVPYLMGKFYSASRFDSLIDGINREITSRLTIARRFGSSVYNSNTFPRINSFYGFRSIIGGTEQIRLVADGADMVVYDATPPGKAIIFNKTTNAKARFLTVGTTLYICDGTDNKKWVWSPIVWTAGALYTVGQYIIDSNGNIQVVTTPGNAGTSPPAWNTGFGLTTPDGSVVWTNKGNQLQNWQIAGPAAAPSVTVVGVGPGTQTVSPTVGTNVTPPNASSASPWTIPSGLFPPHWASNWGGSTAIFHSFNLYMEGCGLAVPGGATITSIAVTVNYTIWPPWPQNVQSGLPQLWLGFLKANTPYGPSYYESSAASGVNGSRSLSQNNDGTTATWTPADLNAATFGVWFAWANGYDQNPPSDRTINISGVTITVSWGSQNTGTWRYGFTYENSVTGDETTGSPLSQPVTGIANGQIAVQGPGSPDQQWDTIKIYRTAQGQSTPLYLASVPNPGAGNTWSYTDNGVPDSGLIAQEAMPQFNSGDPPPPGFTAPEYHCGRVWGIVGNNVVYSEPLSQSGFAPLNTVPIQGELPIRLFAGVTSNGPTLFVWGTVNIWAIFGDGTASNPFGPAVKYMGNVGILSYDCVTQVGSTYYAFTSKKKFVSLDPGAGYVEAGFPIGDQFKNVTTGGIMLGHLYNPATAYVTWCESDSGDSALYVADGSVGWFRFSPVASPESGYLWSPRAVISNGTSAVQSIEVSTGVTYLLIGPVSNGPILRRDSTVFTDWVGAQGTAYPSWDVKGSIVLCQSGQVAEIAHIALKSAAVGNRPLVSLLLGEISPTLTTPFDQLQITSTDPPDLPPSTTVYSDRYSALQNGVCPKCDNFQLKIDYGQQAVADELLMYEIYGARHAERKQQ